MNNQDKKKQKNGFEYPIEILEEQKKFIESVPNGDEELELNLK